MPEATQTYWNPQRMQAFAAMMGGGAQAVMGEHQDTWQAMLGGMGKEMARTQQQASLIEALKQYLGPGQKLTATDAGVTTTTPFEDGPVTTPAGVAPQAAGVPGRGDTSLRPATSQEELGKLLAR